MIEHRGYREAPTTNQDKMCPTGFTFLENVSWGVHFAGKPIGEDTTEDTMNMVSTLKATGYDVQFGEAYTIHNKPFSEPDYLHHSVFIKRYDNEPVSIGQVWAELESRRKAR